MIKFRANGHLCSLLFLLAAGCQQTDPAPPPGPSASNSANATTAGVSSTSVTSSDPSNGGAVTSGGTTSQGSSSVPTFTSSTTGGNYPNSATGLTDAQYTSLAGAVNADGTIDTSKLQSVVANLSPAQITALTQQLQSISGSASGSAAASTSNTSTTSTTTQTASASPAPVFAINNAATAILSNIGAAAAGSLVNALVNNLFFFGLVDQQSVAPGP